MPPLPPQGGHHEGAAAAAAMTGELVDAMRTKEHWSDRAELALQALRVLRRNYFRYLCNDFEERKKDLFFLCVIFARGMLILSVSLQFCRMSLKRQKCFFFFTGSKSYY